MTSPSEPYSAFVAARFIKRAEGGEGLVHAAIGMLGELIELQDADDRANQEEELGDFEFYFEAGSQVLGEVFGQTTPVLCPHHYALERAIFHSADVLDQAKKVWVYGKPIVATNFRDRMWSVRHYVDAIYRTLGFDKAATIAANRTKLLKRYPTTYTDQLAQERRDKQ